MSRPAAIAAALYLVAAIYFLVQDAISPPSGGWISLKSMLPFLVTFPVSAPLAMMGIEPDLSNRFLVAGLVSACAALIYGLVAGVARLFTSS